MPTESDITPGVFIALRTVWRNRDALKISDAELDAVLVSIVSHSSQMDEAEAAAQLLHARRMAAEAQANFDRILGQ